MIGWPWISLSIPAIISRYGEDGAWKGKLCTRRKLGCLSPVYLCNDPIGDCTFLFRWAHTILSPKFQLIKLDKKLSIIAPKQLMGERASAWNLEQWQNITTPQSSEAQPFVCSMSHNTNANNRRGHEENQVVAAIMRTLGHEWVIPLTMENGDSLLVYRPISNPWSFKRSAVS